MTIFLIAYSIGIGLTFGYLLRAFAQANRWAATDFNWGATSFVWACVLAFGLALMFPVTWGVLLIARDVEVL